MKASVKSWILVFCASLFLYLASYFYLSVNGGYELYKTGVVKQFGLPTWDVWLWQPEFGRYDPYFSRTDILGRIYSPLISADQNIWHKAMPYFRVAEGPKLVELPPPPESLMHPRLRHNLAVILSFASKIEKARANHDSRLVDQLFNEMEAQMQ